MAHGDTYEEPAREIQDAIAGVVAAMKEKGSPLPFTVPANHLAEAGIAFEDEHGRLVDLHALRDTSAHI